MFYFILIYYNELILTRVFIYNKLIWLLDTVVSASDRRRGEFVIPPRDVYINEPVAFTSYRTLIITVRPALPPLNNTLIFW